MADLPRLREHVDPGVSEMIRAGRADGPTEGDRRRLLSVLGDLDDRRIGRTKPRSSRWIAVTVAAGVAVAGGLFLRSRSSNDTASPGAIAPPAAPSVTAAAKPAAVPSIDVRDLPSAVTPSDSVTRSDERPARSNDAASLVSVANVEVVMPAAQPSSNASALDELATVVRVRRLTRTDPAGARAAIALYREMFARGRFVEEIDALEIDALAAGGEDASAKATATAFLTRYPSSPYARRVRSLVLKLDPAEAR